MSSYKMELRSPKGYGKEDMASLEAPLLIIASRRDIFFPADRVFSKAKKIFKCAMTTVEIDSKHLPSEEAMIGICKQAIEFLK